MKLSTMMRKAIDYFEKTKPEGASIRGCIPQEFCEGDKPHAIIKIEYAIDGDYTESDKKPFLVEIYHNMFVNKIIAARR